MNIATLALSVLALCSTIANAWMEDERCKNRRQLQGSLDEKERVPKDLNEESAVSVKDNLRGSDAESHRQLGLYTFRLKMHHEEGYCWQNEWEDREWCASCVGGTCSEDEMLWVQHCGSSDVQRFVWEQVGETTGKLKPYTRQDLCWTATSRDDTGSYFRLRPCEDDNDDQVLDGLTEDSEFELFSIVEGPSFCVTQSHHPKAGEEMFTEDCENARYDVTSLWEVNDAHSDLPEEPEESSSTCERGGLLYQEGKHGTNQEEVASGHQIVNFDFNIFVEQERNGNLRVFRGWPDKVGDLLWESGVDESDDDYYTKLQGDGNMITYRGISDDTSDPVWKTGKSGDDTHYFFGVECDLLSVVIYEFYPDDPGALLWSEEAMITEVTYETASWSPGSPTAGEESIAAVAYADNSDSGNGESGVNFVSTTDTTPDTILTIPFDAGAMSFFDVVQEEFDDHGNCNQGIVDARTVRDDVCQQRGGKCSIGWREPGDKFFYKIKATDSEKVNVRVRVSSRKSSKRVTVAIDGVGSKTFMAPGRGWTNYNDRVWYNVQLPEGEREMTVTFDDGDMKLCAVSIEISG